MGWLIVLVAVLLTGERSAPWRDVQALVAAGEVDAVRIVGELPARANGYSVVEVHWRHNLLGHTAEVVHISGKRTRPPAQAAVGPETPVFRQAPSSHLTAVQPDLLITHDQQRSSGGQLLGWQVPTWLGLLALVMMLLTLGLLVSGPPPWRATRWAWFWLSLTPIGVAAFLLPHRP